MPYHISNEHGTSRPVIHHPSATPIPIPVHHSKLNQIPFIQEELGTDSETNHSSYPSILALKLSFTPQASNDAVSILSPPSPKPADAIPPHDLDHSHHSPNEDEKETANHGEHEMEMSRDSHSYYHNHHSSPSHEPVTKQRVERERERERGRNSGQRKSRSLSPRGSGSRPSVSTITRTLPTIRTVHKFSNQTAKFSKGRSSGITLQLIPVDSNLTTDQNSIKFDDFPDHNNNHNHNHRKNRTPELSSLLDHEDAFDPPEPSLHFSTVGTPTGLNMSKTTMLQSVVEEASECTGTPSIDRDHQRDREIHRQRRSDDLHQHNQHNAKHTQITSLSNHPHHRALDELEVPNPMHKIHSAGSAEYHQYKRRREEFNKMLHHHHKEMMMSHHQSVNMSPSSPSEEVQRDSLGKRKPAYSDRSRQGLSSSLQITANKRSGNINRMNRSRSRERHKEWKQSLDIRRPQTHRMAGNRNGSNSRNERLSAASRVRGRSRSRGSGGRGRGRSVNVQHHKSYRNGQHRSAYWQPMKTNKSLESTMSSRSRHLSWDQEEMRRIRYELSPDPGGLVQGIGSETSSMTTMDTETSNSNLTPTVPTADSDDVICIAMDRSFSAIHPRRFNANRLQPLHQKLHHRHGYHRGKPRTHSSNTQHTVNSVNDRTQNAKKTTTKTSKRRNVTIIRRGTANSQIRATSNTSNLTPSPSPQNAMLRARSAMTAMNVNSAMYQSATTLASAGMTPSDLGAAVFRHQAPMSDKSITTGTGTITAGTGGTITGGTGTGTTWEMDRDKLFVDPNYMKSLDDISMEYESLRSSHPHLHLNAHPNTMNNSIQEKLSQPHNDDHEVCKKEIHDAYERGFLAGYFLGVNIMQQQQSKDRLKFGTK